MRKNWKRLLALFLATAMIVASGVFTTYTPFRATDSDAYVENLDEVTETVELAGDEASEDGVLVEDTVAVEDESAPAEEVVEESVEETPSEESSEEEVADAEESEEKAPEATEAEDEKEEVDEAEEIEAEAEEVENEAEAEEAENEAEAEEVENEAEAEVAEENAEVEEEELEEEEEEIPYPAVSFDRTTASGVKVYINAPEGAFPEGTTVYVSDVIDEGTIEKIEGTVDEDKVAASVVAVDIVFRDVNGNEIEPETAIAVSIIPASAMAGEDFSVVHVEDNGTATTVEDQGASNTGASFESDSFTIYAVVGSEGNQQQVEERYTINVGDTLNLISNITNGRSDWSVSNSSKAEIVSGTSNKTSATVKAKEAGEVTVSHKLSSNKYEYYYITIRPTIITYTDWEVGDESEAMERDYDQSYVSDNTDVVTVENYSSGGFLGWGRSYYSVLHIVGPGEANVSFVDSDGTVLEIYHFIVSGVRTITASFDANGGSGSIEAISLEIGEGATEASFRMPGGSAYTRNGYEFLGWADNANASSIAYYEGQQMTISSSKTYYAVWQKVSGQIQYKKLNGVSGSAPNFNYSYVNDGNAISVNSLNAEYTVNKTSSYNGYTFVGWSTVEPGTKYAFVANRADFVVNGQTIVPRNFLDETETTLSLYPVFIKNNAMLKIALFTGSGEVPSEPQVQETSIPYTFLTNNATPSNYLRAPYTAVGTGAAMDAILIDEMFSIENKNQTGNVYKLAGNNVNTTTQYIQFYVCKYQYNEAYYHLDGTVRDREVAYLDYDNNGGYYKPNSQSAAVGDSLTVAQPKEASGRAMYRTGYKFDSWNTKADGTGTTYNPGDSITLVESILDDNNRATLYAQWIPNTDTKYVVQWMDGNQLIKSENRSGTTGRQVSVKDSDKELQGYVFEPDNANNVLEGVIAPDGSLVLKLYFHQVFTVSYADTISSGITMPASETVDKNANYTVKGNPVDFAIPNLGYTFLGWSTNSNATTAMYACGDTFKVTGDTVLYAIWLQDSSVNETVPYDATAHGLGLSAPEGMTVVSASYKASGVERDGTVIAEVSSETVPTFTNAGTYQYEATYVVEAGTSTATIKKSGTLTITAVAVTIQGGDKEKTYDGTPLNGADATMTITSGQFYGNDGIERYNITGTQTLVGEKTYGVTIAEYKTGKEPCNYDITINPGKLIVNPANSDALKYQITLGGTTGEATYTGLEQSHSGLTASANLRLEENSGIL
ncbi:MAG: InlB B-repeat-containing protein, partial [Lachnospiraceae bacterium]|nr:InlB B-repeat-containing protein [Lachnospiraceae bacterium]